MRRLLVIGFWLLAIGWGLTLTGCASADGAMKKGDRFFALGEYFDAANQYKKAYQMTPAKMRDLRGQRSARMAECYRRINYTGRAIAAYNNVIRYKQQDSLTYFLLAQQLLKNGQYRESEKMFQTAIDSTESDELYEQALIGLRSAQMAPEWKEYGSRYTVKRMDIFNSRRADYSPVLGGTNGEILYFTSTRNEAQGDELSGITGTKNADIFMATKNEQGKWQRPVSIDTELNSAEEEGACCLSPDGKTMYLTICKTDAQYPRFATLAKAARSDAAWGKPQALELSKDTLSLYAHPAVSPDGNWLYFTSDMPGGLGGLDLWRVRITNNGLVGIENLGAPVNTPGNEEFPTFRPNGDLYFSSDGHEGMGGLDIYIAHPDTLREWVIEHPGYPLNSSGDDFGMTFEGVFNRGFFSSNRGDARGWDHIYSFENPEIMQTVKGWVYEKDGYELTAAQVFMVGNDGTNLKLGVRGDGSFVQQVKPGVDYVFLATCSGYLNHAEQLVVVETEDSEEHELLFPLASITAPVLIDNIFYDYDRATLRPESETALDSLVLLLNQNPNITIELSAHCDYKGSSEYNKRLSQRRAESVVNYLIAHGIASDRLTPVGYGEDVPKTVRRKLTERFPYLKEGDVLTQEFIEQLPEEQQEPCNQLNRRTEFRVLRTTYGMTTTPIDLPSGSGQ
jgi:outer membrane protein OmpA-like peptidoglycan-associated protein/tetratricopeptide (TPR) repeat protein